MERQSLEILLVEDEEAHAKAVRRAFRPIEDSVRLSVASSLREANALMDERTPDLLIVDWLLPDGKGTELLPGDKENALFPAVIMTSHGSEEVAVEAMKAGAVDYVVKSAVTFADMPHIAERALREWTHIRERRRAEKALRENEEKLRSTMSSLDDLVFTVDGNGIFVECFVPPGALDRLLVPPEKFLGKSFKEILPPHVANLLEDAIEMVADTGLVQEFDYCLEAAGAEFWFAAKISTRRDSLGELAGVTVVAREITDRKRTEEALRESEAKYRALMENMSNGVAIYRAVDDGEDFIFTGFNKAGEEIEGISRDELIGRSVLEMFPGIGEFGLFEVFQRVWRTGEPEYKSLSRYKDVRIEGWRTNFVYKLPSGEIVAVCTDETRRVQLEEERDRLFNLSIDMLCIAGFDGFFKQLNPAWSKALGWTKEELFAKPWIEFVHPEDREATESARIDLTADRPVYAFENRYRCKDGSYRWISWNSFPLPEEQLIFAVARDMTEQKRRDADLRESEERYRTLFNSAADAIVILDIEGDDPGSIVSANRAAAEMHGYTLEELLKLNIRDLDTPPTAKGIPGRIARVLKGERIKEEVTHRKKDGTVFPIEINAGLLVLGDHKYILAVDRDITERKRADEALRRWEDILRHAEWGVAVSNSDGTLLELINPAFARMHGYMVEELIGRPVVDVYALECRAELPEHIRSINEKGHHKFESMHIRKDGSIFPALVDATSVKDERGEFQYRIVNVQDISDRKRTEEALKESEERMRLVIESSPVGIGITHDDKYAYVNPSLLEMFGYESPDEIVGRPAGELFGPESRALLVKMAGETLDGKQASPFFEVAGLKRNGDDFPVTTCLTFMDFEGQPSVLGFLVDISEEKALRSQLLQAQKMESIGTLAGGIAHDFNNLLTIISGYTELALVNKDSEDPDYGDLRAVQNAVGRAADLVKQILTFSRKVETHPRPINLNNQVREAHKLLSKTIPKMIKIELFLADNLKNIDADPAQIEQILLNLAVNARDAMPDGGELAIQTETIVLDEEYCRLHVEARPGEYVLLTVSDTGHGIDGEVMDRIFEPFYTTKKMGEGTGLGLAMVFGLVRSHGGHIGCYSEPGAGTTFKVYFPTIREDRDESDVSTTVDMPAFGTETILLVDDEELIRELGQRILTGGGYKVLTACDGHEALEVYRKEKSDISLVILDVMMPEMGGKECLVELLKIDPRVKVLIASGFALNGPTKEAVETGARGFVSKPFRINNLLQAVRKVLDED